MSKRRKEILDPISHEIWDMKYRFKSEDGVPIDAGVEDYMEEGGQGGCEGGRAGQAQDLGQGILQHSRPDATGSCRPGGFLPVAGTGRRVTLFNCFVMGTLDDSMEGIFDGLKEAALTMQQGGRRIGHDFSTLRRRVRRCTGLERMLQGR